MSKLRKFKVELELCGPDISSCEDAYEYISSLTRESDISNINDIFAVGGIEVLDEGEITIEQWNGDPVDEIDVEDLL